MQDILPQRPSGMLFAERSFGIFFVLWGLILIFDLIIPTSYHGLFYGQLAKYMPACCWGMLMLAIGLGRWVAFRLDSKVWRLRLSLYTLILLAVIAALAFFSGLYAATAPLSTFVAYVAYWCHSSLLRDIRLGL